MKKHKKNKVKKESENSNICKDIDWDQRIAQQVKDINNRIIEIQNKVAEIKDNVDNHNYNKPNAFIELSIIRHHLQHDINLSLFNEEGN